ncbi:MAG TPA: nucleotidyltransferase [Actinomycetota bacterium]|nr:nucleotidyltransferase [Actinomycetota bacterium]
MNDLEGAVVAIAMTLKANAVPYMVIGGFANLLWGEPRTTRDLDVTVDIDLADWKEVDKLCQQIGRFLASDPQAMAERTRVVPLMTAGGVPVDLIIGMLTFESEAIARARQVEFQGGLVSVCTPEDLVVHKIISERPRDLDDVVGILRRQGGAIDVPGLEALVSQLSTTMDDATIIDRFVEAKRLANLAP